MGKKQILRAEIERTEDGIILYLQSKIFEELFDQISRSSFTGKQEHWQDIKVYNIPKNFKFNGLRMVNSKVTLFKHSSRWDKKDILNISYLRLVGLGEGVAIHLPGLFTQEEVREYLTLLRKRTEKLYTSLVKRVENKNKKNLSRIGGGVRNELHS